MLARDAYASVSVGGITAAVLAQDRRTRLAGARSFDGDMLRHQDQRKPSNPECENEGYDE
jgi:hypothetical protein